MTRFRTFLAAVSISLSLLVLVLDARGQIENDYVEGQLIVKLRKTVVPAQVVDVRAALSATVARRFAGIRAELWTIHGMTVAEALRRYQYDPRFEYVEPNYIIRLDATFPNDPRFPEMWGLNNTGQTGGTPDADIDAPEGWALETGDSVLIAVIDTGIDWAHPDLADHIYVNPGEIPDNLVDDDGNGFIDDVRGWDFANNDNNPIDGNGHGTHVAGTIGAIGDNGVGVVGVNWNAKLMPIKFLDDGGLGDLADAILAIEYATMMGVRVMNASWGGGGSSQALEDAVRAAGDAGILLVAAAGNSRSNIDVSPHYPASLDLDNVISVANTTDRDQLFTTSSFGAVGVDLGAPGTNILSTFPGNRYLVISGTSMSTPHVSGAASLVWSVAPALGHLDVKTIIMNSVDSLPALAGKTVTGGRLNILAALTGLDSIAPSPVTDLAVIATGSNTATLQWTASGDDGTGGTAGRYDVRYALSPVDDGNFDSATPAAAPPVPQPAGATETFQVGGLDFNTTYFFAVKVLDPENNASPVSNSPSGTTLGVPRIAFAPDSLGDSLRTGGTAVHIVTIHNLADGTLDFAFPGLDPSAAPLGEIQRAPGSQELGDALDGQGASGVVAPTWLHAVPNSGRVAAGGSADVEMRFDATGLADGVFVEDVVIASNDPLRLVATLQVVLQVTRAPDITASAASLDFGAHFIGTTPTQTVTISNVGADFLNVSGVGIDNGQYSVDPAGFVLAPTQSRTLTLSFAPAIAGPVAATLSVTSDDPDTPALGIALAGEGLLPPVISVAPDSLNESLFTGQVAAHPLTIGNLGGNDLLWSVDVALAPGGAMRLYTLTAPRFDALESDAGATGPENMRTAPITAILEDLPGVKILFDRAHGQGARTGWSIIINDLVARGATVDVNTVPITTALLGDYQALWTVDVTRAWTSDELSALRDWIAAGGSLLLEGDDGTSVPVYNTILATLGAGIRYAAASGTSGTTPFIFPHQTTQGVTSIFLTANVAHLFTVTTPAAVLVNDISNVPNTAYSEVGKGRIVAMADEVFANPRMAAADNQLFANQVFGWLAGRVPWLTVEPGAGADPPDSLDVLTVTYDATGLAGGSYNANIIVSSNDPLAPAVTIPAHLEVTGAPDIAVSDSAFDYGAVLVANSKRDTLRVANEGAELLEVSVALSGTNYNVDTPAFTVAAGARRDVVVTFTPGSEGPAAATLTLTTNDPDEPTVVITLDGTGILPPVISVAPDSLSGSLFTGATSTHTLTIENVGASDLEFAIASEVGDTTLVAILRELASRYRPGDNGLVQTPADYIAHYEEYAASGTGRTHDEEYAASGTVSAHATLPQPSAETLGLYNRLQSVLAGGRILFFDDMESGTGGWSHYSTHTSNIDQWGLSTSRSHSGTTSWRVSQHNSAGADALQTPAIDLGSATAGVFLSFRHWYNFDDCGNNSTFEGDGGLVELSTDGGATWTQISPVDGYPYTLDDICSNPFAFRPAFAHDGGIGDAFVPVVFDLTAYAGGVVSVRFHAGWDCGSCEANEGWYIDDVTVSLEGVGWIAAAPSAGTVPPGGSADVVVTFDATGLFGGDYNATVLVESNDPVTPETRVAARLHVTGAPDIALSEPALDYGAWFVGSVVPDTIVVTNIGAITLVVTGLSLSNSEYVTDTSGFILEAAESRELIVSFRPTVAGTQPGTLAINSNDPDRTVAVVTLSAEGLPTPGALVRPKSVRDRLRTGSAGTRKLVIRNKGDAGLVWSVRLDSTAAARRLYTLEARVTDTEAPRGEEMPLTGTAPAEPITALLDDLTGARILWDRSHAQTSPSGWSTIMDDLITRGAIVNVNLGPFDAELLNEHNMLWVVDGLVSWSSDEIALVTDWVTRGGAVLFEADGSNATVNQLLSAMAAGIVYARGAAAAGATTNIFASEITRDVGEVTISTSALALLRVVTSPAHRLVDDVFDRAVAAFSTVGRGRVVALSDELFHNSVIGASDNRLLANHVVGWLAAPLPWLNVSPDSGTTPPGGRDELTVTFDAAGLAGGRYDA
ncbi:MAG: DUF4350 domain-containing protein, partial [Candidatus Krumholzibacteria bacterium]